MIIVDTALKEREVVRQVDDCHPPASQFAIDVVLAEGCIAQILEEFCIRQRDSGRRLADRLGGDAAATLEQLPTVRAELVLVEDGSVTVYAEHRRGHGFTHSATDDGCVARAGETRSQAASESPAASSGISCTSGGYNHDKTHTLRENAAQDSARLGAGEYLARRLGCPNQQRFRSPSSCPIRVRQQLSHAGMTKFQVSLIMPVKRQNDSCPCPRYVEGHCVNAATESARSRESESRPRATHLGKTAAVRGRSPAPKGPHGIENDVVVIVHFGLERRATAGAQQQDYNGQCGTALGAI